MITKINCVNRAIFILMFSYILAPVDTVAQENSTDTAIEEIFKNYGISFSISEDVPNRDNYDYRFFYVSEIEPGSVAHSSGIEKGDVLSLSNPNMSPASVQSQNDPEIYSKKILDAIKKHYVISGVIYKYTDYYGYMARTHTLDEKYNRPLKEFVSRVFVFNENFHSEHIGVTLKLDSDSSIDPIVKSVISPSPASVAGLRAGDKILNVNGGGTTGTESDHLRFIAEKLHYARGEVTVWVERGGKKVKLTMPERRFGQPMPEPNPLLTVRAKDALKQLPDDLRKFFEALYLRDFDRANREKKIFFTRYYQQSAAALFVPIVPGLQEQITKTVEESRLEGALAQYILVKSNDVGICDGAPALYAATETLYRVIKTSYGIELSRRIVEQNKNHFAVPQDFASIIEKAQPTRAFAEWADEFSQFVRIARGCDSEMLPILEANMIEYVNSRLE